MAAPCNEASFDVPDITCGMMLCAVPSGYPQIVENPTLKAVERGRNTVMLCSATGSPEPSILWLKNYIPVNLSDPRIVLLHTGQCVLRAQHYCCVDL